MDRDGQLREAHRLANEARRAWQTNPFEALDHFLEEAKSLGSVSRDEAQRILKSRIEATSD